MLPEASTPADSIEGFHVSHFTPRFVLLPTSSFPCYPALQLGKARQENGLSLFCKETAHKSESKQWFSVIRGSQSRWQSCLFAHQYFPHTFIKTHAVMIDAVIVVITTSTYCTVQHVSFRTVSRTSLTILSLEYLAFFKYLPGFSYPQENFSYRIFCIFK